MDRLFDRLGDLLRTVLGGDATTSTGRRQGRPRHADDPDLAAAWDELDAFLEDDAAAPSAAGGGPGRGPRDAGGASAATADPREHLRPDYATLEVAFGAPMSDVKRAYKRMMQAHHPDRFAHDPGRQATATRKAIRINAAYSRIERASRTA